MFVVVFEKIELIGAGSNRMEKMDKKGFVGVKMGKAYV